MSITSSTFIPTHYGMFQVNYHKFPSGIGISFTKGDITTPNLLVRIHSSCLFTESFHSKLCDCELQLSRSMRLIEQEDRGVIAYTYEEGRGIGLEDKIRALEIERIDGIDTVEAFKKLGYEPDLRDYKIAINILKDLKVSKEIRLATNNPEKQKQVEKEGYVVTERVALTYPMTVRLKKYLSVKKEKMGHVINASLLEK